MSVALFIAGKIKSGKSSTSSILASRFDAPQSAFGDEVRRIASDLGIDVKDRNVLQDLGERLVENSCSSFVNSVVKRALDVNAKSEYIIVEGFRHLKAVEYAREILHERRCFLIYLDATDAARHNRAITRGTSRMDSLVADSHSTESNSEVLKTHADIVVSANVSAPKVCGLIVGALQALMETGPQSLDRQLGN